MRTKVALDFKTSLGDASLAQFAANILARVKGNPKFSTLQPFIVDELQPACADYTHALQEAADGSHTKIAEKRALRPVLIEALEVMAAYLLTMPENSEALILESGFQPRLNTSRVTAPQQVQQLRARKGKHPGEVILEFEHPHKARSYGIEWSGDGGQQWHNGTYSTARKAVISGLPIHQQVMFRVYAIGTQQRKGALSVPTTFFVL